MIPTIIFYVFASILILSALLVVASRNPVHAVLFLILAFFNAAGLMLLAGAEFLAFILTIVYVGAVAVLFLFVVMMLDINFQELRRGMMTYLPVGGLVGVVLLLQLGLLVANWQFAPAAEEFILSPRPEGPGISNTHALGHILYTDYALVFQVAGLVLLVAMIGAITLTLRHRPGVRRQNIAAQTERRPADVLSLQQPASGQGVDIP